MVQSVGKLLRFTKENVPCTFYLEDGSFKILRNVGKFPSVYTFSCEPGSVVGIATGYGLDGPWIKSRWRRNFPHLSRPAVCPTHNGYRVFPGGKERLGRDADRSPHIVPLVMKE
jgi:hypothetical protein